MEISSRTHKLWGRLNHLLMKRTPQNDAPETVQVPASAPDVREIPHEPEDDWDDDDDE